ncbi:RNA polymerase sigma factor [Maribacter dokdonensis]|uniref:RNA polymerase sigma factor n=1 Tax=Maribacter dokdonensis TaxID=320912 RepID=UPI0020903241|nr:DUF6596 domain-containing protein [Maribacter dokdonensis]
MESELFPQLFKKEFGKIVSVLCKRYGAYQLEIIEDIVCETFMLASEVWGTKGIPENPSGWLYKVAQKRLIDQLRRQQNFRDNIAPKLMEVGKNEEIDNPELFTQIEIEDSQIKMMFLVCDPINSKETQIALALRILCGFGISDIADAFFCTKENINKRLQRGKARLKKTDFMSSHLSAAEIEKRIENVLMIIYLVFNKGYFSQSSDNLLQKEVCYEAIDLGFLLSNNLNSRREEVYALLSLMCFHASRLDARIGPNGQHILYDDQEREKWDKDLIGKGEEFLNKSAYGTKLSKFHLEASIAYWHTFHDNGKEKWENILLLFNYLLQLEYSPTYALNRGFAIHKVYGPETAIKEVLKLKLTDNHLYHALLGYLNTELDQVKALNYFKKALKLANNQNSKKTISTYIESLNN